MLILSRKIGGVICIGDDIKIKIVDASQWQIKVGIDAPKNIAVHREEIYNKIKVDQ